MSPSRQALKFFRVDTFYIFYTRYTITVDAVASLTAKVAEVAPAMIAAAAAPAIVVVPDAAVNVAVFEAPVLIYVNLKVAPTVDPSAVIRSTVAGKFKACDATGACVIIAPTM